MDGQMDLKELKFRGLVKPIYCPRFGETLHVNMDVLQKIRRISILMEFEDAEVEYELRDFKDLQSLICSLCQRNTSPPDSCEILELCCFLEVSESLEEFEKHERRWIRCDRVHRLRKISRTGL